MNDKLTTGRFARLCHTTKETLYHYRDIGLLLPQQSPENGYYYYTMEQFFEFEMIKVLKECKCSLADIRLYLNNYSSEKLVHTLKEKRIELQQSIQELQRVESLIGSFIDTTTQALTEPCGTAVLKEYPEQYLIATPLTEHFSDAPEKVAYYMNMHYAHCIRKNITEVHPMATLLCDRSLFSYQYYETHFASFLPHPLENDASCITLPGGTYAVIHHHGGYHTITDDFFRLCDFIQKHHLTITGTGYTKDLISNLAAYVHREDFVIQICIPVQAAL